MRPAPSRLAWLGGQQHERHATFRRGSRHPQEPPVTVRRTTETRRPARAVERFPDAGPVRGRVRRRRHRAGPSAHRQAAGRDWLRGDEYRPQPRRELASFDKLNTLVLLRGSRGASAARAGPPRSTFEEVIGGLDESNGVFEAHRCVSGGCAACDSLLWPLSVRPRDQARAGRPLHVRARPRLLQGLRDLRRGMPVRRDHDGARKI